MMKAPAFAVLRLDKFQETGTPEGIQMAVTVTKVFMTKELADAEVARLNALNGDKDVVYWAMYTRLMTVEDRA
jgi:hypothetical protein